MEIFDAYKLITRIIRTIADAKLLLSDETKLTPEQISELDNLGDMAASSLISDLNGLGDIGETLESYARRHKDKNLIDETKEIDKISLNQITGIHHFEQETRRSIARCIRHLYNIDNMTKKGVQRTSNCRYVLNFTSDYVKRVYNDLIKHEYLPKETAENDFLYYFGLVDSPDTKEPLKWLNNQYSLVYFIDNFALINKETYHHNRWEICANVFLLNKTQIAPNISTMKTDSSKCLNGDKAKPKDEKTIDNIIGKDIWKQSK